MAYLDGRLFRGANDGRVYALDAATGRELWKVRVGDPERGETFPAAPVAWRGKVFIGNAGGDNLGVTGRMAPGGLVFTGDLSGACWRSMTETGRCSGRTRRDFRSMAASYPAR